MPILPLSPALDMPTSCMVPILLVSSALDVPMPQSVMHFDHSACVCSLGCANATISHACAAYALPLLCIPDDADVMLQRVQWQCYMQRQRTITLTNTTNCSCNGCTASSMSANIANVKQFRHNTAVRTLCNRRRQ